MTTFEKTWQFGINYRLDSTSTTTTNRHAIWWFKAFLMGQLPQRNFSASLSGDAVAHVEVSTTTQDVLTQGLWTCYYSSNGTTAGTAGDGYDYWANGTIGIIGGTTLNMGGRAGLTSNGAVASFTTGATIVGAVRLTGVTNMAATDVGNFMTITGAATAANNSATNTPFKIVQYNSATSVDIYNPLGATTDANNGAISWVERNPYIPTTNSWTSMVCGTGVHPWFVLKSPLALGPYYIILDYNTASAVALNIWMSKTAPTGGTTSARPTATDEVQILSSVTLSQFMTNVAASVVHGMLSTDGYFTLSIARGNGTGYCETAWFWQILADTKSADLYKAVSYYNWQNSGDAWLLSGLTTNARWAGRYFNGSNTLASLQAIYYEYGGTQFILNDMTSCDLTDSQVDDLPIYLFNNSAGQYTIKGRLVDIRQCPAALPSGFTEPSPSSPTSIALGTFSNTGGVWLPCNLTYIL